jgi:Ca-activated chloride channel family protein
MSNSSLRVSLAGILLLAFCSINRAQESAGLDSQTRVLKVDVDRVLIRATVSDAQGRFVSGLGPERFRLSEDKVEQKIESFSEEDVPLSAGIIFDASGSMKGKESKARESARAFLTRGNREDEYFLVEVSSRPRLSENFTTETSRLQNHFFSTPTQGMTALFDAVYLGLERIKNHGNARKALLLITDGEDNHSRYTLRDIKNFVKEQDVQIFAIGILDFGAWQSDGRSMMEELVGITGGKAFFPSSVNQLESICARIAMELKNQYIIGYRSTNEMKDGKWRKIHVQVIPAKGLPQLNVRTKSGYYAPSSETSR